MSDQDQIYRDYSNGRLSRQKVMRDLDIEYWQLLDGLAERGHPFPRLPADEVEEAAIGMLKFLDRR